MHRDAMTLTIAPAAGDREDAVQRSRIVAPAVEWDMRPVVGPYEGRDNSKVDL